MSLDRRKFLFKSTMACVSSSLLGASILGCKPAHSAKVVVIGAGLAGLNCARLLEASGIDTVVLEANTKAGGRTMSVNIAEQNINMGGVEVGDGYKRFIGLAKQHGLSFKEPDKLQSGTTIYRNRQLVPVGDWPQSDVNPLPEELKALSPTQLQFSLHSKDFPLRSRTDWLNADVSHFDVSEGERLRSLGADQSVIDLINRAGNFNTVDGVSSLHVMRAIANYKYGTSTKTIRLDGGNDRLAISMANSLENVRYGRSAVRVSQFKGRVEVECQTGEIFVAEQVIIAVPFSILRKMRLEAQLPQRQRRAINQLPYTKITKMVARVESDFWVKDGLPANMWCDSSLERCFLTVDAKGNAFYTIFINGAGADVVDRLSELKAQQWVLEELARARPSTKGQLIPLAFHSWGNDPFAQGAYAAFAPSQITDFAHAMVQPSQDIFFAGEHCSRAASGMEGALESAELTTDQILKARA